MNKPTEETLRQLNGNIAVLWGWDCTRHPDPESQRVWRHRAWPMSKWVGADELPNWAGDLNLVHAAEASLLSDPEKLARFSHKLFGMMDSVSVDVDDGKYQGAMYYEWHAEAWMRAVCLDRTLSETPIC